MAFTLLAISLPTTLVLAQTTPTPPAKPAHVPTHMPAPQAEPENPGAYASPARPEREGPSEADVGPVQKHFVRAFKTDDLAETENEDNAHLNAHEKIAIDKRISVPKIHDVQDDNQATNTGNDALDYEIKYLNWGATTHEQQLARQGHYFTITWNNDGPKADFVARFQYRQVKSKEVVRTLMQTMPAVSGTTRSYFAVVDKAYLAYGPVCSWRFTILKGDTIVAESKSFIW
ncbi:MAG: hypothetical protein LV479_05625 [Methylacidiphilales bacterium]|nr:hypothetical protein [Candidatus Methylacidiphilales bacterium]